jgi:hypothetical protein
MSSSSIATSREFTGLQIQSEGSCIMAVFMLSENKLKAL